MTTRTILQVAYPLAPVRDGSAGGAEAILARLDEAVARAGHRSIVLAMEGSRVRGALVATPAWRGDLDAARAQAHAAHRAAIAGVLARERVDLVHLHGIDFASYLPPPGPPALVTLHLPPSWYPPEALRPARPRTYLQCVSASQRSACPRDARVVDVVPNGVPLDVLRPARRKRDYAIALGRICPEKGFHLALDAAAIARIPIILAGEIFAYPAHRRYFDEEIAPRLQRAGARFVGPLGLTRKRRLLAAARCLVVPSLAPETSSLVAMEALACGTPVVAWRSGALPEIVEHGRTGFVVDDVASMADAIRAAAEIAPSDCRRAAEERFSEATMTSRYSSLYERVIRGDLERAAEAAT